jgi:hypothetical protein
MFLHNYVRFSWYCSHSPRSVPSHTKQGNQRCVNIRALQKWWSVTYSKLDDKTHCGSQFALLDHLFIGKAAPEWVVRTWSNLDRDREGSWLVCVTDKSQHHLGIHVSEPSWMHTLQPQWSLLFVMALTDLCWFPGTHCTPRDQDPSQHSQTASRFLTYRTHVRWEMFIFVWNH